ncbi:hypothetical protein [Roseivirga sp. UBA838]|jgi:hypothetical protein|uniref:hypothetical protein n=1 Tax=Roseivirga sp. UBA838 TaxID=1947393 RepID=UPI00257D2BCF|nr:hypothetical protein [Roseivirga sp. UBA838]|tara:strand:+ start:6648 stop:7055 length:408 start_codon:yes stop_codon:yes gene_type:complete
MESYRIYINTHLIALLAIILIIATVLVSGEASYFYLLALVQMPLAFIQHLTGIHFITSQRTRSARITKGFRLYWILSIGYWLGLFVLYEYINTGRWLMDIYLFAISWPIPIYQYWLVKNSYNDRLAYDVTKPGGQ